MAVGEPAHRAPTTIASYISASSKAMVRSYKLRTIAIQPRPLRAPGRRPPATPRGRRARRRAGPGGRRGRGPQRPGGDRVDAADRDGRRPRDGARGGLPPVAVGPGVEGEPGPEEVERRRTAEHHVQHIY